MRRYRSAAEWDEIIVAYRASGQSVSTFCREHEVCESSIYRRLSSKGETKTEFVELPSAALRAAYEICVSGVALKVPSNESAERIAELMRAVRC
jgi:hypothetical protein